MVDQANGGESVCRRVLSKIAEVENTDPIDVSPRLQTVINPDALEKLISRGSDEFVKVEFSYASHQVTVEGDETVQVRVE